MGLRPRSLGENRGLGGVARVGDVWLATRFRLRAGAPSADILPHEQVREAAQRALARDWETALSYGVGIGHPGLCQWVAERHGDLDPAQVMITNGSLEAGAMLFQHLLGPGDRVVGRAADLRPHPAAAAAARGRAGAGLAGGRRARPRRAGGGARRRGRSSSPTSSPTPTTRPAARSRRRSAGAWSSSPPSTTSGSSRTTPTASCPSRASRWRRCSRWTGGQGDPRLLLLEDGQPRRPRRLPRRPRRGDREAGQKRQRDLHLAEHAGRVDRARALPLRRARPQHRVRQGRAEGALRRAGLGAARADPRGRVRRPRRRLLPLARPRRGHRQRRPAGRGQEPRASPSSPAPTS